MKEWLDQWEFAKRALAGDNIFAEFKAGNGREIGEEGGQATNTRIPGWDNWTGLGIVERKAKKDARFLKQSRVSTRISGKMRSL